MRWKQTLLLVLTAVVLALYVYTSEIRPTSAVGSLEELRARAQKVFYELGDEIIDEVVISRGKGDVLSFRRAGPEWEITQPIRARAAPDQVRALVTMLADLKRGSPIEVENLSAWGLSTPGVTVVLRAGGRERTLGLGSLDLTGKRRFARLMEGETREVFLVDEVLAKGLKLPLAAWQSMRVVSATKASIESVEVIPRSGTGGERVGFSRQGPRWRMLAPVAAPANGRKVERLIEKLTGLTADRQRGFVGYGEEEALRWGLDSPRYTVRVLQAGGKELVLRVWRAADPDDPASAERLLAYASDYPVIFALAGEAEDWLQVEAATFRSPRAMEMRMEEVEGFNVRYHGQEMQLARRGEGWVVEAPRKVRASGEAVAIFLEKLGRLKAEEFVPPQEGVNWEATVAFQGSSDGASEELRFGRREGEEALRVYVQSSSSEDVLVVKTVLEVLLPERYLAFRDRQLIDLDAARVRGFEVERAGRRYRVERDGQTWQLGLPVKGGADNENVDRLVHAVTRLEVERYVEDGVTDPERFGLAPRSGSRIEVRMDLERMGDLPEEIVTLRVGRGRRGSEWYADSSVEKGLVFTIGQEVIETLEAELARRDVLQFDEEDLAGITVGGLRIVQDGRQWKAVGLEDGQRLDQKKLAGMIYELSGLRAERFVTLGDDLTRRSSPG